MTSNKQFVNYYFLFAIILIILLFFNSCGDNFALNKHAELVVIIKADDLGDTTPNWNRFIKMVTDNEINAGIGIITKNVKTEGSISEIKRIATIQQQDNFPVIEFWNHGYDHSEINGIQEFKRKEKNFQLNHIKMSQNFFKKSLFLTCHSFGAPFNESSYDTFLALENFPDINVWLCYQRHEKQYHSNWKDTKKNKIIYSTDKRIILNVDYESLSAFRSEKIINNYHIDIKKPYILIQIHPAVWNDESFNNLEKLIRFYKDSNRAVFMTPYQYYQYLIKTAKH